MAAGSEMRVSDAEREAAASELREHFASGRLDQDELNERLDRAFAAKTRGDLNALFTDLPSSWRSPSSAFGPVAGPSWQQRGSSWQEQRDQGSYAGPGRRPGAGIAMLLFLMPVLLVFGVLSVFGIGGGGRPIGIVLILAAFALLRRLLFLILGRRGRGGRGGGRGGRGPRRSRR